MNNDAYSRFLEKYPAFKDTTALDLLRKKDYQMLDSEGHIYLDYTGGGLYASSQLKAHQELLRKNIFGNPHSTNPTSLAATKLIENTRSYVLKYFHADPTEYDVIFTANASGALKIIRESYPFESGSHYALTFDNHNSVNGIREFARGKGGNVITIPVTLPEMRVDQSALDSAWDKAQSGSNNLFAYPAQSNFSAVKHPLEWIEQAHKKGWDVLLDAAAFAPTNRLDLAKWKPDFVALSFYKIFGYPTGLGALVARRKALSKLVRPWFAGGTITVASVQGDKYYLAEGHTAFEDGTVDYLNIPAVEIGLKHIESIGIETIEKRVRCLTGCLLDNLVALKHSSGVPLVRVYGPITTESRGGAVAVNFFNTKNQLIDHRSIEKAANKENISLRTGCFCNPGAGELALGISRTELEVCFSQTGHENRLTLDDFRLCIDDKPSGAVRISVGLVSNFEDVQAFIEYAKTFLDK